MLELKENEVYDVFKDKIKACGKTTERVVDRADPTALTIIKAEIFMMYGFTDEGKGFPPAPEIVTVEIEGMWGDRIKIKTSCGHYEVYYEYNRYTGCEWTMWLGNPQELSMILKRLLLEGEAVTDEYREYCEQEEEHESQD